MLSRTGDISEWNGSPDLSSYYPAPCDDLYGSVEGTFLASDPITPITTISYFSSDLCRPLSFSLGRNNKYWLEGDQLANSSYNETAWCYNPQPDLVPDYYDLPSRPLGPITNSHLPTGLINVSACAGGSPQYISLPHFYQADPALLAQFHPDSELVPDENLHSSHIDLQDSSGAVLEAVVRLQVNVLYRELPHVPLLENRTPTFHPVLWYEVIKENNFLQSTTAAPTTTASGSALQRSDFIALLITGVFFCFSQVGFY